MSFAEIVNLPIPKASRKAVIPVNLGLYLDRAFVAIPDGGLIDCRNVRLKEGKIINGQMGYERFMAPQLNGAVILIDQFFLTSGSILNIFGTATDLYSYDEGTDTVTYITPIYATGTVSVISAYDSGNDRTTITGLGTLWNTAASPTRPGGGGTNVKVGDEIHFGSASENDPDETWYVVESVDSDTQIKVTGDASAESTGAYTIRQLFDTNTDLDDVWFSETFPDAQPMAEDRWYATNNEDVVTWDGSDPTVSVIDLGFSCRTLVRHKNMMLYGGIVESGQAKRDTVRNSAISEPENVSTKEAAEVVTTDGIDDLSALVPIGDVMAAYHDRSINIMQFVGLPLVWVIRTAVPGIGPFSSRGIMDFGDFHEFLGSDTGYRFDGVSVQESGGHVFREVLRLSDASRRHQLLTHIDEENGDVLWAVPLATDPDSVPVTSYVEHYLENVGRRPTPYTIRDFPATESGFYERTDTLRFNDLTDIWTAYNWKWNDRFFAAGFPQNIFGDKNGNIWVMNEVEFKESRAVGAGSFTKEDIESWARLARAPAMDGRQKGMVQRVEVFAEQRSSASYTLAVITRIADQLEGPIVDSVQRAYDLTQVLNTTTKQNRFVNPRIEGRFYEIEFATTGQNRPWEVAGYAVETQEAGE